MPFTNEEFAAAMQTIPTEPILEALAPSGTIRAAINFGNPVLAQRNAKTNEAQGITIDLANEIARRLGAPVELLPFDSAGAVADAVATDSWDIAFLAIDPARAARIKFTAPYVVIEGTYLVPEDSTITATEQVDVPGIRIAVGNKTAYDLYLSRTITRAELVRAPTSVAALDLFLSARLEVAAGVRQPLVSFAEAHPRLRVLDGRFMTIQQAVAIPKHRELAAEYVRRFVEDVKASGFVAERLAANGQTDAEVAPSVAD